MPRPGRNIHEALLASGRELYPQLGCAGLSVRALTQHAGVNLGMFHYHFRTKDAFLEALLQRFYEEMFEPLSGRAEQSGPALARLRDSLIFLARFSRDNAAVLGRVFSDATAGHTVAASFVRANAPRHLKLLLALMRQAEKEGALAPLPAVQRFVFVMGAVGMPLIVVPHIARLGVAPALLGRQLKAQVTRDAAIAQRVDLALAALKTGGPA